MIEAAIFDMDGLIVDSEPLWQEAEIEVFAEVGVRLTRAQCTETKGRRVDETIAYWYERRPWTGPSTACDAGFLSAQIKASDETRPVGIQLFGHVEKRIIPVLWDADVIVGKVRE